MCVRRFILTTTIFTLWLVVWSSTVGRCYFRFLHIFICQSGLVQLTDENLIYCSCLRCCLRCGNSGLAKFSLSMIKMCFNPTMCRYHRNVIFLPCTPLFFLIQNSCVSPPKSFPKIICILHWRRNFSIKKLHPVKQVFISKLYLSHALLMFTSFCETVPSYPTVVSRYSNSLHSLKQVFLSMLQLSHALLGFTSFCEASVPSYGRAVSCLTQVHFVLWSKCQTIPATKYWPIKPNFFGMAKIANS